MSMTTSDATRAEMTPAWEQPGDAAMFWTQDRMHFPYPISRMEDDLARLALVDGLNRAHELHDIPARMHARRFWTYHYASMVPLSLAPDEMQAMAARSEQTFGQLIGSLDTQWETAWLPAIMEHISYFRNFDLSGATDAAMAEHLEETIERLRDLWLLHFKIVLPAYLPISLFEELYRELFGDESALRPYQLLQGLDNKTVESGNALWRLSRIAGASQAVRDAFENLPPDRVVLALEVTPEGQRFLVAFNEFLQEYGKRGETWGLNYPSWIEDPTPVIKTIRDYINNPGHDPERDHALLAEEREQLIAEARAALATYPEAVRGKFEAMLAAAKTGIVLSEDHGYWIDFQALYEVRRVFVEIGRRFVKADVASAPDDIFHLSFDEARDTLRYLPRIDRRELVASRRAEMELYRTITPPPMLGTPPDGAPPDDPGARTMGKFFGGPPPVSEDPDILFGAAGSSGIVRGPARVIRDIADAARLQPGDIMVTVTTAPPWTPLFGTAAAVVTDTGGVLSHCAVVAREYRIPAVVGTGVATMTIEDGQVLEVDGDRGSVRIIRDA